MYCGSPVQCRQVCLWDIVDCADSELPIDTLFALFYWRAEMTLAANKQAMLRVVCRSKRYTIHCMVVRPISNILDHVAASPYKAQLASGSLVTRAC